MNAHPQPRPSLYQELEGLPGDLVGEILNGRLYTQPRPSGPHGVAGSVLGMKLGPPFQFGDQGPGGRWIIDEPELQSGAWCEIGRFAGSAAVPVAPFEAVSIRLNDLWAPT